MQERTGSFGRPFVRSFVRWFVRSSGRSAVRTRAAGASPAARAGSRWPAFLAIVGIATMGLGSRCDRAVVPVPGTPDYQGGALVAVPGAVLNVATANLTVVRTDLVVDSQLGRQSVGAAWNSADGRWRWSFELEYGNGSFVDGTGARYDTTGLQSGQAIPGSSWVVLSDRELKTKGGLLHRFDPESGALLEVRWTSSLRPRLLFEHAGQGGDARLVRVLQERVGGALDLLFEVERDAADRVRILRDGAGREARFTYDASGRLATARDPLDLERGWPGFRYGYGSGQLVSFETSEGERCEFSYRNGRPVLARAVGESDPTARFEWGDVADGLQRVRVSDVMGSVWTFTSDLQGRLREVLDPLGDRSTTAWQGLRPASRTAPDGSTTRWSYENDDVVAEVRPSGNVVRFTYARDAVQRDEPDSTPLATVADDLGVIEIRRYDEQGRLVEIENGEGERTVLDYHPDEMLREVDGPDGRWVLYEDYSAHGHARRAHLAGDSRELSFDAVGNRLTGDDPRSEVGPGAGGVRRARYDGDRNAVGYELVAQRQDLIPQDPLWLEVEYRSDGRPTRIRRPYGGDSEWVYDALGRMVARRDRVSGQWWTTSVERDPAGRITAVERPNGMREEWRYDAAGRVERHAVLRDGLVESEQTMLYEAGRLVRIDDSAYGAPERRVYDAAGRLALVVHPGGEQIWLGYDLRSRIVSRQYVMPDLTVLATLSHEYDLADREIVLVQGEVALLDRTFQDGQLTRTRYANGVEHVSEYDDETGDLLSTRLLPTDGGPKLAMRIHERGPAIPCIARYCLRTQDLSRLTYDLPTPAEEFYQVGQVGVEADDVGKRLLVSREGETGPYAHHTFDQLSNRTSFSCADEPEPVTAVFNAERNRLLRLDAPAACGLQSHAYRYDDAGFVVERDGRELAWDGAGRIRAVGDEAEFAWDSSGRPLWRRLGAAIVRFRFGGAVEADVDGVPVALELREVRIDLRTGSHLYRHFDFRGNVLWVSDEQGELVRHILYGAYGSRLELGDADDPYDFARGLRTGRMLVLGHRLLDPDAAAFLAPDPVFQLINQYSYTLGNPVWFWDPDGRQSRSASSPRTAIDYAWGTFFGAASFAGGAVGFAVGGPVGGVIGSVLGLAAANNIYQLATGEQGVGYQQFKEEMSPLIIPKGYKPTTDFLAPGQSLDLRPGEDKGYKRPGPRRWHGPPRRSQEPQAALGEMMTVGGPACGLGFEVALVVAFAAALRSRRRLPRGRRMS